MYESLVSTRTKKGRHGASREIKGVQIERVSMPLDSKEMARGGTCCHPRVRCLRKSTAQSKRGLQKEKKGELTSCLRKGCEMTDPVPQRGRDAKCSAHDGGQCREENMFY